jgi:hypothetical protein
MHLTYEHGCLGEDVSVEALGGLVASFGAALGVDPVGSATRNRREREDSLEELYREMEESVGRASTGRPDLRVNAAKPQPR